MACSTELADKVSGTKYAFGKAGKIAVLCDDPVWENNPGDTMSYYFGSAFPILPQPEPLFDLQHQTFDDLIQDPIRKQLRAYIVLANLADAESPITKMVEQDLGERLNSSFGPNDYQFHVGKNKWAQNQLVLYIIGKNESGLIDGIKASLPSFTKKLHEFDKIQYQANLFLGGHNVGLEKKLADYYGIKMSIPDRYKLGIDKKPFLWLQDVSPKTTSGLIFYSTKYEDKAQFSEENMIVLRDSLTKAYITSSAKGSYMQINNVDLPTFYYERSLDGKYTGELRGIWDMKNDFMGGAFVSFTIHNPSKNEIVFIDGFVYGPGHKKREALKHLIYLIEEVKMLP